MKTRQDGWVLFSAVLAMLAALPVGAQQRVPSPSGGDPEMRTAIDTLNDGRGNGVPDFSHAGYMGGDRPIPDVPVRVVVPPADGDDGARIQAALDHVAGMPADAQGIRGAVLLERGRYEVDGQLRVAASGVVLRGSGPDEDGTILTATGHDRRALIHINGTADRTLGETVRIAEYVRVGAIGLLVDQAGVVKPGDTVTVTRTGRGAGGLRGGAGGPRGGAGRFGQAAVAWDRGVTAVQGTSVTLDAPLTMPIDPATGAGGLQVYRWPGRIEQVGIENLRLVSAYDERYPMDEDHAWVGVTLDHTRDAWVRRVTFQHFAGSAVSAWGSVSRLTVEDCRSLAPVSEEGGWRRHTFFTAGQQTLFLRCDSERGRHDFMVASGAQGPNAFVHCDAREALGDSGSIGGWATGVLFDNVNIDGAGLRVGNEGLGLQSGGWTANGMLWQCTSSEMECSRPPEGQNWAFGCWSMFRGDGVWNSRNEFVQPKSLMQGMVAQRLGAEAGARIGPGVVHPSGSTNPTYRQAEQMVANSNRPAPQLSEVIANSIRERPLPTDAGGAPTIDQLPAKNPPAQQPALSKHTLQLTNGWLTVNGRLLVGGRTDTDFWRGTTQPEAAARMKMGVTRFVPGRVGPGLTDDLDDLTNRMVEEGIAALEHHHGLWYDRRRDDHERIRRPDGEVWPPFYEMPFARSGQGTAWDGLSKYDLTRYNTWYFDRLDRFASLCEQKGLALVAQHYFQHNILEAGAHWAEFPWRSANNINQTGFPEPPPYAGDKRIFQAHLFYDIEHPVRRPLHTAYIRHYLDELGDRPNVIHLTSGEYSGPLLFTQFWLDTVGAWERQSKKDVLVGLSCCRDVQDSILNDPARSDLVNVIDIRYWWYQGDGRAYAPAGGRNLAPRQHARQLSPKPASAESIYRAVREYRSLYPNKAVIYTADESRGQGDANDWAVVMGGGSLPGRLPGADAKLLAAVPGMRPADLSKDPGVWCLAQAGSQYLVYVHAGAKFDLDLSNGPGTYQAVWLDPATGLAAGGSAAPVSGGRAVTIEPPVQKDALLWLTNQEGGR